jgi:predicted aconitase with swiveling domain
MNDGVIAFPVARAEVIQPGAARGRVLKVATLSFWGGVDPATGRLSDPAAAAHGEPVAGRVLLVAEPRGSSSSSAVMLELLRTGRAPAAVVLGRVDAILGLGIVVAREMGWPTIPLYRLPADLHEKIPDGADVRIGADGSIRML